LAALQLLSILQI